MPVTNECVVCERPTPDGWACHQCARKLAETLREAAGHAEDADTVIARQTRYGGGSRGGSNEPPLPYDPTAADDYATANNTITTWARHILEATGAGIPAWRPLAGPPCRPRSPQHRVPWQLHRCPHPTCNEIREQTVPTPLAHITRWLADQLGWLRTRPEAPQAFDELHYACQVLTRLVDIPGRAGLRLVGMCDCGRILYAPHGRDIVQCKATNCGASWNVTESQDILRAHLDKKLVTAGEAAHLAGFLATDRSVKQIRALVDKWGERRRLEPRDRVLIKHKHRGCKPGCAEVRDVLALYRFGDIAALMATTERRVTQGDQTCRA